MYINPLGEEYPSQKLDIIQKKAEVLINPSVFGEHIPGNDNTFGVCLIVHPECVSAKVVIDIQEREWLLSDAIKEPKYFVFLTLNQIKELDPHCGDVLECTFY